MRHFLIDTDTASDDAVALVMAAKHPEVRIEAVTLVAGNVTVEQGLQNALYTLELCEVEAPVFQGAAKPILQPLKTAQFVHGKDGMGDVGLDLRGRFPKPGNAIDVIVDTINQFPNEIELVTLGPLTNIAIALLKDPTIAKKVKQCVVMGGVGQGPGNITPVSEFNIWVDPEAARIVFSSGMKIKMVGWDITTKFAYFRQEDEQKIRAMHTPLAQFAMDIQKAVIKFTSQTSSLQGFHLPDPIAMAVAIDPGIATKIIQTNVEVICSDNSTRGQTVVDHEHMLEENNGVEVVLEASREKFLDLLHRSLRA